MSSHLLKAVVRAARIPQRSLSTTPVCARNIVLDQQLKDEIHPKIGSREIVGYGSTGRASYIDACEFPAPAIRFKEDTAELKALKEKEKGDWKTLSLAEKKELYRASFCQTYSEMNAPTGDWKVLLSIVLFGLAGTGWLMMFMKKVVYTDLPGTFTREWQEKSMERMIMQGQGPITGVSSHWDYEKEDWK